jgi:hypothetical protein
MNVLLIGGLLVVAAAAVIGAILLGRSDQGAEGTRSTSGSHPPPFTESSQLVTRKLEDEPATALAGRAKAREEERPLPFLNGQFHELASELRTLHQQSIEFGQRLSTLTEIVDHLERTQAESASLEEDHESANS